MSAPVNDAGQEVALIVHYQALAVAQIRPLLAERKLEVRQVVEPAAS